MSRKPPKGKSLAEVNPELAKQWHPTKNGELTPEDVSCGSDRKVWWKCTKGEDHEWSSAVSARHNGNGCGVCGGKVVVPSNSLATLNPELSSEWHKSKNGQLKPTDVLATSTKKVWWKCLKGDDHIWQARISKRNNGQDCPICLGRIVVKSTSLVVTHPDIAREWHPTKNIKLSANQVTAGSGKKVWWKCIKDGSHEWETTVNNRKRGKGCPICSGRKVIHLTSLESTHPELVKEWHHLKNKLLKPNQVNHGSNKPVWWKCNKGPDHEWKAMVNTRTSGKGCPICAGQLVVLSNSIASTNPEIAKEWHPTKNGELTPKDVSSGSKHKVWWQCSKINMHVWKTAIQQRCLRGSSCPYCTLTPQSKQELIITFELVKIFPSIDPKGLKAKVDEKVQSIDIFIPELNLGVEFDGSYWHKGKRELDKVKTLRLEDAGFNIIRIREEPLKKIFDTDIISKQPYDGKEISNNLLKQIMSTYKLDKKTVSKIEQYLLKDELQNQKGLDEYIEQILTEKAEKKSTAVKK